MLGGVLLADLAPDLVTLCLPEEFGHEHHLERILSGCASIAVDDEEVNQDLLRHRPRQHVIERLLHAYRSAKK